MIPTSNWNKLIDWGDSVSKLSQTRTILFYSSVSLLLSYVLLELQITPGILKEPLCIFLCSKSPPTVVIFIRHEWQVQWYNGQHPPTANFHTFGGPTCDKWTTQNIILQINGIKQWMGLWHQNDGMIKIRIVLSASMMSRFLTIKHKLYHEYVFTLFLTDCQSQLIVDCWSQSLVDSVNCQSQYCWYQLIVDLS